MSLLLDALKRAEEAKRAKQSVESEPAPAPVDSTQAPLSRGAKEVAGTGVGGRPADSLAAPSDFSLEDYKEVIPARKGTSAPRETPSSRGDSARIVELSLEGMPGNTPEEKATHYKPAAVTSAVSPALQSRLERTRGDAGSSRDTARSVLAASQAPEGAKRKWLLPAIAIVGLAVGGGGWYVWSEMNRLSRPGSPNMALRPVMPLPPAQAATGQAGGPASKDVSSGNPAASAEPALPPLLPPPAERAPLPKLASRASGVATPRLTEREELAKSLKEAPVSREAPVELRLARSMVATPVNAEILDAYAALKRADYPQARSLYAKAVVAEPLSPDAQLGMATVLARIGDNDAAARHYRLALASDPRNGDALAGLLSVSDTKSPALEAELRALVDRNPDASALRFAQGNLYASERRWVEAQKAYFEAYRLESTNADYLYNLAVSLDQLKQPALAMDFYQKALAAHAKSAGQFDPATVTRRLRDFAAETGSH